LAKGDIVVGLDIGTTKVCTLVAEVATETGRVDALGVGVAPSIGIRRGVVVDIEQTVRAIEESVQKAQRMAGADVNSVIVGVTGEHIASLNSRGVIAITHPDREVTQEDVTRVLENSKVIVLPPDREIVHAIPRGYTIDGQNGVRSPVGMSGTRLEVETHIVTGATSFLRNVVTCVERASLEVDELVLEPIATGDAVVMEAEKELGVALVDIGGGTSDLAIVRGGDICYSSIIPVGGNYVTRDISAGLRMTLEEAERVKLTHGLARVKQASPDQMFTYAHLGTDETATESVRTLAEIIEPRVAEAFQMVRREINRSDYANMLPAGLVLSGGGAMLTGLRDLASDITGLPTRIGFPTGIGGLAESVSAPSFATAVGLVQWGGRARAGVARREPSGGIVGAVTAWMRRVLRDVVGR
jgi:cell division protein FtsA